MYRVDAGTIKYASSAHLTMNLVWRRGVGRMPPHRRMGISC